MALYLALMQNFMLQSFLHLQNCCFYSTNNRYIVMTVLYHVTSGRGQLWSLSNHTASQRWHTILSKYKLSQALIYLSVCHNTQKSFSTKSSIPDVTPMKNKIPGILLLQELGCWVEAENEGLFCALTLYTLTEYVFNVMYTPCPGSWCWHHVQ